MDVQPPAIKTRVDRLRAIVDDWSARRTFAVLLCTLLIIYLPSATYDYRINVDAAMAAMPAWNLIENGTLDLAEHREELEKRAMRTIHTVETSDGAIYSNRTAGVVLWGVPFYALASPLVGSEMLFPMWPAAVAGAVATALAMAVLHLVLRRVGSPFEATVGALIAGLGTGAWSVAADGLWPHGPSMLGLAVAMLSMSSARFAGAGMAFALALVVRPYNALAAAVSGLGASLARRSVWPAVRVGLPAAVGLAALIAYNTLLFDQTNVAGGYSEIDDKAAVTDVTSRDYARLVWNLLGTFLDPQRGLVWYSPFLVLLALGLRRAWSYAEPWVRYAAVSGGAVLLAQYWVQSTQGGSFFFSYRYPLDALMLSAPLFLVAWQENVAPHPGRQRVFRILVVLAVSLQVLGAVVEPYKA